MDNFTREELKIIIDAFNWIETCPSWRNKESWDDEVKNKLQSMFDNYCDPMTCHHNTENWEPAYQCDKCKKYYGMQIFDEI